MNILFFNKVYLKKVQSKFVVSESIFKSVCCSEGCSKLKCIVSEKRKYA